MKRSHRAIFLICVIIWLIAAGAMQFGWVENLEMKTVDARFRLRHLVMKYFKCVTVSDQVILVGVDEKSVDPLNSHADRWGVGGWLTRDHWIDALGPLVNHFKPKVVAYDIIFSPFRTPHRVQDKSGGDDTLVDTTLQKSKETFSKLINDPDFPRIKLLNLLDEACNTTMASRFYDIEDSRAAGKTMPHFITACSLTYTNIDHAVLWDPLKESDKKKIGRLVPRQISSECLGPVPSDYLYGHNAGLPFDDLVDSPIRMASINVPRDEDGTLRRVPLVIGFRNPLDGDKPVFIPSMSLMACLIYLGLDADPSQWKGDPRSPQGMHVDFGRELHVWAPGRDIRIPIDSQGRMFLNFAGTIPDYYQVPYVAVSDYGEVLAAENSLSPEQRKQAEVALDTAHRMQKRLQGRIALIGLTFTGGTDVGPCAVDSNTPLVFIHMTAIDNILRESFLRPMNHAWTVALLTVLLGLIGWINTHRSAGASARNTVALLLGTELMALVLFFANITIVPMMVTGLPMLVAVGAISLFRYGVEQKGRMEIRKKFSAMVSGKVLQYMEEHPEKISGERREVTMFFSDVAGFTSMSEKLSPEKLGKILNDYLTPMADLILAHDGYLNKFAGDGIMAVWGVPYPDLNHASLACMAALQQQVKIQELKPVFREQFGLELKVRMGLNTGVVSAGNMGSKNRYEYTVMGDAVNFAARLEPSNKEYGTSIMIGEQTHLEAKDVVITRRLDRLVVTGKTEPVQVYELVGRKGDVSEEKIRGLRVFEEGLELYWKREWEKALEAFHETQRLIPHDPPAQVFIHRAKHFQLHPPPEGWKGEYKRASKD